MELSNWIIIFFFFFSFFKRPKHERIKFFVKNTCGNMAKSTDDKRGQTSHLILKASFTQVDLSWIPNRPPSFRGHDYGHYHRLSLIEPPAVDVRWVLKSINWSSTTLSTSALLFPNITRNAFPKGTWPPSHVKKGRQSSNFYWCLVYTLMYVYYDDMFMDV